jgi:hypothetical protein
MLMLLLLVPPILLLCLFLHGHRQIGIKPFQEPTPPPFGEPQAGITMVIPMTGADPSMSAALNSLARQNYPKYEMILVVGTENDQAMALATAIASEFRHARVVLAGEPKGCSRKNHGLLAGLAQADPAGNIYVFCDSTHVATGDFLSRLVGPIIRGEAVLTTGCRRGRPESNELGVLATAFCMQLVQLLLTFPSVVQPWGGATAIQREIFQRAGVADVWSHTVLDDMPLGLAVQRIGHPCRLVPDACLETPLRGIAPGVWLGWWYRQLHYIKFYIPVSWALTTVPAVSMTAPLAALLGVALWLAGVAGGGVAMACAACLGLTLAVAVAFRSLSPAKIPLLPWVGATVAGMAATGILYLRTWTSNTIRWRGVAYKVGMDGRVRAIRARQG